MSEREEYFVDASFDVMYGDGSHGLRVSCSDEGVMCLTLWEKRDGKRVDGPRIDFPLIAHEKIADAMRSLADHEAKGKQA